ncbi:MAG TPA: RNase adapter RapZ, partial [Myxococcales bacterium]|nr:RNase adapter RapZ [Myxococcales bacterium]
MSQLRLLIVTGISGSGRTTCLRALEDAGWYCVDNLPARLLLGLTELMGHRQEPQPIAVGIDVRAGAFLDDMATALDELEKQDRPYELLFLDCSDEVLVRRFAETRRKHPVVDAKNTLAAIGRERELMMVWRERTALVIDTSVLNVHQLKAKVQELFSSDQQGSVMTVAVRSFGFKHGVVRDADYVLDVRCLQNPHFVDELRHLTGKNPAVRDYVLGPAGGQAWLSKTQALLAHTLPMHRREG